MQTTPQPAQASAEAGPTLTTDTNRLRDLWLPRLRDLQLSLVHMDKACEKAFGKKTYKPLHTARMSVWFEVNNKVAAITIRGGLLLIGGAA